LKKVILPPMGVFSNTGGFFIKRYQRDISIAKDRILEGIRNDQKATISDKQYDLCKINIATLILHALDDRLVGYDFATYAHAHIPNSELIPFPSGGHILLGHHEQYREVVAVFLKKHL